MPTGIRSFITVALLGAAVSSCSSVSIRTGPEGVDLATRQEIAGCMRIGRTTVTVADKVSLADTTPSRISAALVRQGRIAAADMKGDTIVPASQIHDGEQTFDVYRCVSR